MGGVTPRKADRQKRGGDESLPKATRYCFSTKLKNVVTFGRCTEIRSRLLNSVQLTCVQVSQKYSSDLKKKKYRRYRDERCEWSRLQRVRDYVFSIPSHKIFNAIPFESTTLVIRLFGSSRSLGMWGTRLLLDRTSTGKKSQTVSVLLENESVCMPILIISRHEVPLIKYNLPSETNAALKARRPARANQHDRIRMNKSPGLNSSPLKISSNKIFLRNSTSFFLIHDQMYFILFERFQHWFVRSNFCCINHNCEWSINDRKCCSCYFHRLK